VHLGGLKQKDIIKAVSKIAEKLKTTILLKMHVDIIADAKRTAINRTGDPRMTVGGTGDTLAGILGALLARGCDPFIAACAAAFINGVAGELAAKKFGEGMLASDMLQEIPKVIGI
jgi:NAD(P)H-hydrate epimerase